MASQLLPSCISFHLLLLPFLLPTLALVGTLRIKSSLRALKVEGPSGHSFSNFNMNMNIVEQDVVKEQALLWQISAGTWDSAVLTSFQVTPTLLAEGLHNGFCR